MKLANRMTHNPDFGPVLSIGLTAASLLGNAVTGVDADVHLLLQVLQCAATVIAIVVGMKSIFGKKRGDK